MDHRLPSTPGKVHWGLWDATLPPVLRIASGDRVTIDTLSGEPEEKRVPASDFQILPDHKAVFASTFRGPGPHLLTGPIFVEGAESGDGLEVRLLDNSLRPDWRGNLQLPFWGTLPEDFPELRRLHIPLDRERNIAQLPWGQELPLAPLLGNFGGGPPHALGGRF